MKKPLILAGMLFAATNVFASSINIDIDLGGVGNILERVGSAYYKAFYNDNGSLQKSDIRLREAKNASIKGGETTQDGINAIFNLTRGTLIPSNPNNQILATDLISTNNPGVIKKDFSPGIEIYSSNNIQIKRGYLFSQEFLKFFNVNLLFEGVKNYTYTQGESLSKEEKIKNATLLLLLDKFNIRSFNMFFDSNVNSDYSKILNGLANLRKMIDNKVKGKSYRNILENKIQTIQTLLKFSKAIFDTAKNARIKIKRYTITGNNRIQWTTDRVEGISVPYIEIFPTNAKDRTGHLVYSIDRTHVKYLKTYRYYCGGYTGEYCWGDVCFYYYREYGWYYDYQDVCYGTESCENPPSSNASSRIKRSYAQNCFYNINVNTVKQAIKNVLNSLNNSYGQMANNILIGAAQKLNVGSDIKDTLRYLTNNIPNLTDIMVSVSQSYATRDINAIYRKPSDINMLDFMDDIQEVIGLKQYKYNKDLDVARVYPTAVSLSNFSNGSIPPVSQEQLEEEVQNTIKASQQIKNSSENGAPSFDNANAEKYMPITPSTFISSGDNETSNAKSTLASIPAATTSNKAVSPDKMLIIYLNPFNTGSYSIIFGTDNAKKLLNKYLTTNFDSGTLADYDIFGYGIDKANGTKYFLGEHFLTDSEQTDYLKNSFALFGEACTQTSNGNVCTLQERHVDSPEEWIDIGENNIMHLYNMLIPKIGTENNVVINNNDLIATLNEIDGFLTDANTGDSLNKLVSILNGEKKTQNESMKADTFMPFKAKGLLVQSHYEIKHYVIKPVTKEECNKDKNGTVTCIKVITGYKWVLDSITYPDYSCNAGLVPTSQISTMFLSKTYGNYVNGQISSTNVTYHAIGTTQATDFAKFLSLESNATNSNTVIGGTEAIPYSYEEIANLDVNYVPSPSDCMAHGLKPGCSAKDIGVAVNCSDMGSDDFWNSHTIIEMLKNVKINGIGESKLVYKYDYKALNDNVKAKLIDPDIAAIYSFNEMMPGIGTSGFNDTTNVYKMIFLKGDWKDTVITNTVEMDTGNNNTAGVTLYDCGGTIQTTMCSQSQIYEINSAGGGDVQ